MSFGQLNTEIGQKGRLLFLVLHTGGLRPLSNQRNAQFVVAYKACAVVSW